MFFPGVFTSNVVMLIIFSLLRSDVNEMNQYFYSEIISSQPTFLLNYAFTYHLDKTFSASLRIVLAV